LEEKKKEKDEKKPNHDFCVFSQANWSQNHFPFFLMLEERSYSLGGHGGQVILAPVRSTLADQDAHGCSFSNHQILHFLHF